MKAEPVPGKLGQLVMLDLEKQREGDIAPRLTNHNISVFLATAMCLLCLFIMQRHCKCVCMFVCVPACSQRDGE